MTTPDAAGGGVPGEVPAPPPVDGADGGDARLDGLVPPAWRWVHLAGLLVASGFYFFIVYACMRGVLAEIGSAPGTIARAAAATAAMAAFVVWLAPLADLPQIVFAHVLPRRRIDRHACPACGYAMPQDRVRPCSECGRRPFLPTAWQPSLATARRFLAVLLAGLTAGIACGEWWTRSDELRFRNEAAGRQEAYMRPRSWPADFASLRFDPAAGVSAHRGPDAARIAGWRPGPPLPAPKPPSEAFGTPASAAGGDEPE